MADMSKPIGTDAKVSVEIDPSAPGTIVRILLAAESAFNIFSAIPMIFHAEEALGRMYLSDDPAAVLHAAPVMQLLGISLAAMTVPIVLAIPNKAGAVEKRRTTYQMLASFEALALPVLFWQARISGEASSRLYPSKLTGSFGLAMGVALGFRVFVLLMKPEWMGKYRAKRIG
ncbi:hypothetical protein FOMG_18560 [Fusarium oxysporum f. sp. melonis 26406]|uniref:Uncharacterized protein n=2 Tax=Fusarium oxysporum TaxID=5507 RepID=A0A2H3G9D3_FUSOX|nr:hypothetical protein FOMG_18560 [Fusarium oxysporum f. sp. melonis 26406]PCD22243.1 hypothetical protein AU210_016033 [Fusarium oxysporum f. sp. radicis-cucumerinum]